MGGVNRGSTEDGPDSETTLGHCIVVDTCHRPSVQAQNVQRQEWVFMQTADLDRWRGRVGPSVVTKAGGDARGEGVQMWGGGCTRISASLSVSL